MYIFAVLVLGVLWAFTATTMTGIVALSTKKFEVNNRYVGLPKTNNLTR